MKTLQLQVHSGKLCNRVSIGDRHDNSVEFFLKHSTEEALLITKSGSRMMCYAGSLEEIESVESFEPPEIRLTQKAETATQKSKLRSKPKSKPKRW